MLNKKLLSAAVQASVAPTGDANFKQTVLLLHGDGTNGAQNNTFVDGSTNNFTITRNGNTTQGTFTPFSQPAGYWSNYFDGSGDFLNIPDNAAFDFGSGDFTIEGWFNCATYGSVAFGLTFGWIVSQWASGNAFTVYVKSPGAIRAEINNPASVAIESSSNAVALNTWYHFAFVRNGNTFTLYLNGNSVGTASFSGSVAGSTGNVQIGREPTGAWQFNGYVSNLRIVKGTALYTSAFTPPTAPLTAITNTVLLTCQDNRFRDVSSNNFAITRNGDVRVTAFSPFAPTAAYSPSVNGGSGYFDGTGDYLSFPEFSSTTDFTAECWFYRGPDVSVRHYLFSANSNISTSRNCQLAVTNGGEILVVLNNAGVTGLINVGGNCVPRDAWSHIAFVRSGTNISVFVNGARVGNATSSATLFVAFIGAFGSGGSVTAGINGYVSNARITNTAVYDPSASTITVPTAPLTAVTGTHALLNFTNAGIIDSTGKNVLETVGNAQIDTTVKKYGTGSMEFDGTGDWLLIPYSSEFVFGTGDFTVECWVYPSTTGTVIHICGVNNTTTAAFSSQTIVMYKSSTEKLVSYAAVGNTPITCTSSGNLTANQWSHVAFVRSGSTLTQYINGTADGTASISTSSVNNINSPFAIGQVGQITTNGWNGYIDDLRITKGVARYTTNFTPPTAPFEDL
jgi:hypothetical protein